MNLVIGRVVHLPVFGSVLDCEAEADEHSDDFFTCAPERRSLEAFKQLLCTGCHNELSTSCWLLLNDMKHQRSPRLRFGVKKEPQFVGAAAWEDNAVQAHEVPMRPGKRGIFMKTNRLFNAEYHLPVGIDHVNTHVEPGTHVARIAMKDGDNEELREHDGKLGCIDVFEDASNRQLAFNGNRGVVADHEESWFHRDRYPFYAIANTL